MSIDQAVKDLQAKYNAGQIPDEIAWFYKECIKVDPKVVVEIGVYAGGNLKILNNLIIYNDGLTVGIDLDWDKWKRFGSWDLDEGVSPVVLIDGNSHEKSTIDRLKDILEGKEIDVLFIDGDHTYEGCKMDYDMYSPLVRKGGIIAIHDINMKLDPKEANPIKKCGEYWDDLQGDKHSFYVDKSGYGIGYIIK